MQDGYRNVFSGLEDLETCCFISADEMYVKTAVRFRGNHIIGLAVDETLLGLQRQFSRSWKILCIIHLDL